MKTWLLVTSVGIIGMIWGHEMTKVAPYLTFIGSAIFGAYMGFVPALIRRVR